MTNLLTIYGLLADRHREDVLGEFAGKRYTILKRAAAELVVTTLEPIQRRYLELCAQPETFDAMLDAGAERARPLAGATLVRVRQLVGLDDDPGARNQRVIGSPP